MLFSTPIADEPDAIDWIEPVRPSAALPLPRRWSGTGPDGPGVATRCGCCAGDPAEPAEPTVNDGEVARARWASPRLAPPLASLTQLDWSQPSSGDGSDGLPGPAECTRDVATSRSDARRSLETLKLLRVPARPSATAAAAAATAVTGDPDRLVRSGRGAPALSLLAARPRKMREVMEPRRRTNRIALSAPVWRASVEM